MLLCVELSLQTSDVDTLIVVERRHHSNKVANSAKTDKDGNAIKKPTCILQYNNSTGGVDLMDQQLASLLVLCKCYQWYKNCFCASFYSVPLVHISCTN